MPLVPSPLPSIFGAASVRMSISIDFVSFTSSAKAVVQVRSSRKIVRFMRAIVTPSGWTVIRPTLLTASPSLFFETHCPIVPFAHICLSA